MRPRDVILVVLWAGLVGVGFWLHPLLGLVLAVAVLSSVSWQQFLAWKQETQSEALEAQLAAIEAALQSRLDKHSELLTQLVEQFTHLRADEAVRHGRAGAVPRLRG